MGNPRRLQIKISPVGVQLNEKSCQVVFVMQYFLWYSTAPAHPLLSWKLRVRIHAVMIVVGRPGGHKQSDLIIRKKSKQRSKETEEGGRQINVYREREGPLWLRIPTPANDYVPPEVFLLKDEGESKQCLQVHALHQQPEVVGQDAELEEGYSWFTGSLQNKSNHNISIRPVCGSLSGVVSDDNTIMRW